MNTKKKKEIGDAGQASESRLNYLAEKISRPIAWKTWWFLDLILTAGISAYWWQIGLAEERLVTLCLSLLIAASPAPLYLSMAALAWRCRSLAAKEGAHFNSAEALRKFMRIDTLAVNKNGIITMGNPYIAELVPEGISKNALLSLAASAEQEATHPIGRAIWYEAEKRALRLSRLAACHEIPHAGVEAIMNNTTVRVGTLAWLKKQKVSVSATLATKNDQLATRGKIPVFVSNGKYARGIIALQDDIIPDTISAIHRLQRLGMKVIMLTNESSRTAAAVERVTDLDGAVGGLDSLGKVRELQLLRAKNAGVAMLGDTNKEPEIFLAADMSIHLLPVQLQANRRISKRRIETAEMEEAAEKALAEAPPPVDPKTVKADLVISEGMLSLFPALKLVQKLKRIERQNLALAYGAAAVMTLLAAGVLVNINGFWLSPWQAFGGLCGTALVLLCVAIMRISS